MKELPIAFSGPMVRALLAGTKTQTRRELHPQPSAEFMPRVGNYYRTVVDKRTGEVFPEAFARFGASDESEDYPCPYGRPGDRLWVREDHCVIGHGSVGPSLAIKYCADGAVKHCNVTPREYALFRARKSAPGSVVRGRFTYRSIARLVLEVVSVRVERLNAISEGDARAEGGPAILGYIDEQKQKHGWMSYREWYQSLWESINGPGSWALNPWVWVISFRRVDA